MAGVEVIIIMHLEEMVQFHFLTVSLQLVGVVEQVMMPLLNLEVQVVQDGRAAEADIDVEETD